MARWECLRRVATDRRRVARATQHTLGPRAFGEFALHFEFAELRLVVGVGNRTGAQTVAMMPMMKFNWVKTFQIQLALKFSVNSTNQTSALASQNSFTFSNLPMRLVILAISRG